MGRTDGTAREEVGLVLAGAGARGAYEAGAMSVLLPVLERRGQRPRIIVGTSAGALNALLLAQFAHLPAEEAGAALVERWRNADRGDVIRRLARSAPPLAVRYLAEFLGIGRPPLTGLLDTAPLRRTLQDPWWTDWDRLHRNIEEGHLAAVGVVTTRRADGRTVVFVESSGERPLPRADEERGIRYVPARLDPTHVLASAAIPVAFPAVFVDEPPVASDWYLDGGLRLNVPIKPALLLGAGRVVVVATDRPVRRSAAQAPPLRAGPLRVTEAAAHVMHATLVDRMVEDLRKLVRINRMVTAAGGALSTRTTSLDGRVYDLIEFVFVGPSDDSSIATTADEVFRKKYGGIRRLVPSDFALLSRLLGAGGHSHGEIMSYLFFDRDFMRALVDLGRADATAMLARDLSPWRVTHMPGTPHHPRPPRTSSAPVVLPPEPVLESGLTTSTSGSVT